MAEHTQLPQDAQPSVVSDQLSQNASNNGIATVMMNMNIKTPLKQQPPSQLRPPVHPVHASQTNGVTGRASPYQSNQIQSQLQITSTSLPSHSSPDVHPQQMQYQSPSKRQSAISNSSIPSTQSFYSTPTRVTQTQSRRMTATGSGSGTVLGRQSQVSSHHSYGRVNPYTTPQNPHYPQYQQHQHSQPVHPVHTVHPPQHTPTRGGNHDYSGNHQAHQQRMMYQQYVSQRMAQQQQYTSYVQQQQYQYYQMIGQQYGYNAMITAMQRNPTMTNYVRYLQQKKQQQMMRDSQLSSTPRKMMKSSNGSVMLSAEDQPLLASAEQKVKKKKRRKKRKRTVDEDGNEHYVIRSETVSLDLSDEELEESVEMGFDRNGYDKGTLINQNEYLPDIDNEFDSWLCFTKKIWKRQKKYKHKGCSMDAVLEENDTISASLESPEHSPRGFGFKSIFLQGRMKSKHNVLKKGKVVDVMIKMGLAPPWNAMSKYKRWRKCFKWNKGKKHKTPNKQKRKSPKK